MSDEQVVAEQIVPVAQERAMTVRISQHQEEEFWRVQVSADPFRSASTTVASADNYMMDLIRGAVSGEPLAWRHLAAWGRDNLSHTPAPAALRLA